MRLGFFVREATRSLRRSAVPSFAAMATVLVTVMLLGVFIPVVQATTGAANDVRGRVIADVFMTRDATDADIARAFVNHPPLLVADEPTGNLDPETSIGIMQLLYRINRTGTTVVVATHDREMVDRMRRRVIQLEQGRVIRDEAAGFYVGDESTREFAARMRDGDGPGGPFSGAELSVSRAGKRAARRATRREIDALPRELDG